MTTDIPTGTAGVAMDALTVFRMARDRAVGAPCMTYFDAEFGYSQVDRQSDALAATLARRGFRHGDRLALFMQNVPHFVIAMLAAWKLGGVVVPISPMSRSRELAKILSDCQPTVLAGEYALLADAYAGLADDVHRPAVLLGLSPFDFQTRDDDRLFAARRAESFDGAEDFVAMLLDAEGSAPPPHTPRPDDLAFLVYTSGTTGEPKGAASLHRNVAAGTRLNRAWYDGEHDVRVLALAPLFHTTGLMSGIHQAFAGAGTLVLTYRFEPR